MLAAGSMQPVLRSLIQAVLKKRAPRAGMSPADLMHKSIEKRLTRATGAEVRPRELMEQGPEALEDRAKALLCLCENLRVELQERSRSGCGDAPGLQAHLDALRASNRCLREITRGGTEVYPPVALLQSAARGLCLREEEERRLQAEDEAKATCIKTACLQALYRKRFTNAFGLAPHVRAMQARRGYQVCVAAGERLKDGARRRRAMIRLEKLQAGFRLEDLEAIEAEGACANRKPKTPRPWAPRP